jgi:hypothetical protein
LSHRRTIDPDHHPDRLCAGGLFIDRSPWPNVLAEGRRRGYFSGDRDRLKSRIVPGK